MESGTRLFEHVFKPRLENSLLKIQNPLTDEQKKQLNTWLDLYAETEESLNKRSKTRRNVRRHARYFVKKVLAFENIGHELFVLSSLSFTISSLPTIQTEDLYSQLEQWWKATQPHKIISIVASEIVKQLEQVDPGSTPAQTSPNSHMREEECSSQSEVPCRPIRVGDLIENQPTTEPSRQPQLQVEHISGKPNKINCEEMHVIPS
jgi:hypothetical protein